MKPLVGTDQGRDAAGTRSGPIDAVVPFGATSGGVMLTGASKLETTQMLASLPLFAGLTKRQLGAVSKAVDHASFEPGTELLTELKEVQRLIIIRAGTAAITRRGAVAGDGGGLQAGTSRRLGTVGPGDVVGELSLIDGHVASASVIAETPIDAVLLYRTRFNSLLAATPELYPRLLVGMATRIRAMDRHTDMIS